MFIDYNTTIALRCPICGRMEYQALSIFSLKHLKSMNISCSCAYTMATVGIDKKNLCWLRIHCPLCSTSHIFYYPYKQFWSDTITKIVCPKSAGIRGYLGPESILKDRILDDEGLALLLGQLDCDQYFHEPEMMLAVLDIIHDIAATGRLFCQCGGDEMEITMYPDHLELICNLCEDVVMVQTGTKDSLLSLQRIRCLLMPRTMDKTPNPEGSFYY